MLPHLGGTRFAVIVAAEDVTRSKPAPDGYLAGARRARLSRRTSASSSRTRTRGSRLAGRPGASSSRSAPATSVAGTSARAHRVIDTLDELTPSLVEQLARDYGSGRVKLPAEVTIYEVGPRDGLQNEARQVPTADKIRFIDALVASGIRAIEITSFVSPKWIPQLADSAEVARGVARPAGVRMSALVPNRRGLDTALAAGHEGDRGLHVGVGDAQQEERQQDDRRDARRVRARSCRPRSPPGVPVRAYLSTVLRLPVRGRGRSGSASSS